MGRILQIICGCVLAVTLGASQAQPVGTRQDSTQPAQQTQARTAQDEPVTAVIAAPSHDLEAANRAYRASETRRADADLKAQQEMARWALGMFIASAISVVIGAVGVGLIYTTFQQTRRAADSADKMAVDAAEATKAALRSATVAEQALVGVERPFVVITPIRSNNQYAAYTFSNYGRTPAVIMHSDVRYFAITPLDGPEPIRANVLQAALTPGWSVVPAGGEAAGEEIVRPGKPIVEGAERANMWLLHGYVMYRSLTGEIFVSGFGIYKQPGEPWQALSGDAFNYDERLEKGGPRKRQRPTLTVAAHKKK